MKTDKLAQGFFLVNYAYIKYPHIRSATLETVCACRETDMQADFNKRLAETRKRL
jgi:hypothetical protein